MKYKVILRKCQDLQTANRIAEEIARWSGTSADAVQNAILQKPVCIRKEAEEQEAILLKRQFEGIGADVDLLPLEYPVVAQSVHPGADDEEESRPDAKVLSDAEYSRILRNRSDIFHIEKDARLRNSVAASMIMGISVGVYMSTIQIVKVASDFLSALPPETPVILVKPVVSGPDREKPPDKKIKPKEIPTDARTLKNKPKKTGYGGTSIVSGDPREHVTRQGILGLISGKITGKAVASADIFGKGGFANGIDVILQGMSGLKSMGSSGAGRKGIPGIGFGPGFDNRVTGDITDAIDGLFTIELASRLPLKGRGNLEISEPKVVATGGIQVGGRSKASVMRVVMQNISALRYAYNKRLREKPGLKGKITCKFAIDEFGKVIFCELLESTIFDPQLEAEVRDKINRWVFDKIDKPGDVTEVQYPFVFAQ
jgi:hypothetical protein